MSDEQRQQYQFYVDKLFGMAGGISFLTLVINAPVVKVFQYEYERLLSYKHANMHSLLLSVCTIAQVSRSCNAHSGAEAGGGYFRTTHASQHIG